MNVSADDPFWFLGLAYLGGAVVCFLVLCYDIGMAPDHVTPPSIFEVLFMSGLWPLTMLLLAYVQWTEQHRGKKGRQ